LFARGHITAGLCRSGMSEQLITDELDLVCDVDPKEDDQLCKDAQLIWKRVYKSARTGDRVRRIDYQVPKRAQVPSTSDTKPTLAEWLRNRDADVARLSSTSSSSSTLMLPNVANKVVGIDGWTEDHQKEAVFQKNKHLVKFLEMAAEGRALPKDLTPAKTEAVELRKLYQAKLAAEYGKKKKAEYARQADPELPMLKNTKMFVDKAYSATKASLAFKRLMRTMEITVCDDRLECTAFMVEDVVKLPQRVQWCLMLGGGVACDKLFVTSAGSEGRCMTHEAARRKPRTVWASDAFIRLHQELYRILVAKTSKPAGCWTWSSSKDVFLQAVAVKNRTKRPAEVLAFLSKPEVDLQEPQHKPVHENPPANLLAYLPTCLHIHMYPTHRYEYTPTPIRNHRCIPTYTRMMNTHLHPCTQTPIFAYIAHTHAPARTCARMHVCTHTYTHTHTYVSTYIHACTHSCVHAYTYTDIRTRSHLDRKTDRQTHGRTDGQTHTYTYTYTYTDTDTYPYTYPYTYTFAYTYRYT